MIMRMSTIPLTGGCLCGAVRYRAEGAPMNARCCHCINCQKFTGSPFYARVMFAREQLTIEGETRTFPSSEGVLRHSCPTCASPVFSERPSANAISVSFGTLDDPSLTAPTEHIWTSRKQPWLKLDDGLPCYPEGPPPT
jgi:hypothetical protein